jgi:hypothetical protein
MTIKDTAKIANKVRADLVKEKILNQIKETVESGNALSFRNRDEVLVINQKNKPYKAEHFKDEDPKDIKRRLVDHVIKPNTTYNFAVMAMSDQEAREEFARRLNNDTTDFSTYTLKHLNNLKKEQL